MDADKYQKELEAYHARISNMSSDEYRHYMREDYEFEDEFDAIPEYLDYVETWDSDFHYQACKYSKSFIVDDLCKRNAKVKCGDHEHVFSLLPNEMFNSVKQTGQYIQLTTETFINADACWYRNVLQSIHRLRDQTKPGMMDLTEPDFEYFTSIIANGGYLKMVDRDEIIKPEYVSTKEQRKTYNAFKTMWYHGCSEKVDNDTPAVTQIKNTIGTAGTQKLIAGVVNIKRKRGFDSSLFNERITLLYGDTMNERHDFHIAYRLFGHEAKQMLSLMNTIRSKAHDHEPTRDTLKTKAIEKAMEDCKLCKKSGPQSWSTPGIYYAPPGNGKTTALEKGFLAAFDTDWLTSGIHEQELTFLLERNIPIVTNQYTAFGNGMTKMIGFFNPDHVRLRPMDGEPFTEIKDVENFAKQNSQQFSLLTYSANTYLYHRLLDMRLCLYLSSYTKRRFITRLQMGIKT